ncbi:SRPBCC family protein [Nocardia vulneris]|uniref:SRPBCC family protein n=1 Tax=Nocardia vulneris TaxID=1141657 RepID=UPI0030CC06B9
MRTKTALVVGTATYLAGLAAGYQVLLRRWCLTWGATEDEVAREMPGDELLTAPDVIATRAITIATSPGAIWPWLVQLGPGRGGAYTYDWIENLLGLNMHSANEVLPQFQNISVGDSFALGTSGRRMRVAVLEPEHALVFASTDGNWVWSFGLYPTDGGTRLVSRNRIAVPGARLPNRLFNRLVMEPGSWVMERKMLIGIKQRAERNSTPVAERPVDARTG